jgi:hypothetical protein
MVVHFLKLPDINQYSCFHLIATYCVNLMTLLDALYILCNYFKGMNYNT